MGRIKNMGAATVRFGEGVIVSGNAGNDNHTLVVTGSVHISNGITGSITNAAMDQFGETIYGGMYQIDDGLIQNPNSSYSRFYFPADDTLVETMAPSSVNYKIAPFAGSLIKIQVKSPTNFTGKTLTASLHIGTGNDNVYSSTPAASVVLNGLASHSVHTFDFTNASFNESDIFGYSLELSENWAGNENIHVVSVVKFSPFI